MYVTGPWSTVYALDARTGRELWVYDPKVPGAKAAHACCDVVNRGAAVQGGLLTGLITRQRATEVAAAEVGAHDLHRRATIGVSVVAGGASHVRDVLDRAERLLAEEHPEVTVLSARHGLHSSED